MSINHQHHIATEISSDARCETINTYEDTIQSYEEQNYSYIPLPFDVKYYDVEHESLEDFRPGQIIDIDQPIIDVINRLQREPFLFTTAYGIGSPLYEEADDGIERITSWEQSINPEEGMYGVEEFVEKHPDYKEDVLRREEEVGNFQIITYADLNKRGSRGMIYHIIAELEGQLAARIEKQRPESTGLFRDVRASTIGHWQKAKMDGVEVHIAEYMTLSEMKTLIATSSDLLDDCGFSSRNQFEKQMSGLVKLRNRVMHANRTMVHGWNEVETLAERIERAEELVQRLS